MKYCKGIKSCEQRDFRAVSHPPITMSRYIDKEPNRAEGPLKVIVAGLGRTGTNCK